MRTADRRDIPDPFMARHRVAGGILVLVGLVAAGVVLGLVVGGLAARILELVLSVVGGAS